MERRRIPAATARSRPGFNRGELIVTKRLIALFLAWVCLSALPFAAPGAASASSGRNSDGKGRSIAVDPVGHSEGYMAVLYDNTNGLPTSEANDIAETSEGFIWIGSYSGLIRYDGNTFDRVDSTTGIASVVRLFVDSGDRLWIGTNDSGVAVMERGEYRMWGKAEGLNSASVRAIAEDDAGVIYVATTGGIAAIDRDMNLTMLDDPRISGIYMQDLRLGPEGVLYGLTGDGSIFSMKDGRVETFLESGVIRVKGAIGLLPDPRQPGYLYVGTESSRLYYGSLEKNFSAMGVKDVSPLNYVERMEYIDGQYWICAGNGIGVIDDEGFHSLVNLPMNNSLQRMMVDYEGNLWFASSRQGVMKVVPNQFSNLYERYGLPADVVNATCLYGDQLFVGTDSGLTVIGSSGVERSLPLTRAVTASGVDLGADDLIEWLRGCRIRSIIRDDSGRIWIATWRKYGLLRYDKDEVMAFTPEDGLFSDRVRVVCPRRDGSVLVANTGGVNVIRGDAVAESYGESSGIVNTEILTVAEAANGDIVLGTDGGGISVVGASGTRNIGIGEGLSSEVIMRIRRDAQRGLFWIVTSNSIAYMDDDYRVTTVRNFPYSNNFDLYEDSKGSLWVLSSNGIYVVSAAQLMENGEIEPVFYGPDNGLPCIATANSYSELDSAGNLYIAGTTGIAKVNIERPFVNVNDLKVSVPYVEADGVHIYPDENGAFTIPESTQKLTISGHVFNYSLINPQVSFQLEGFERHSTTTSRSDLVPIDYTNLRGGTYQYVMQLKDSMGRGNKVVSVQIVKKKQFYEETWFFVIVGLLTLFLLEESVRLYVRKKTRTLEKKQKETMALVGGITEAFAKVIDMKDRYTNGHSSRVAKYTAMLARELGYDEETVEKYYRIALLHDIGKVGVPQEVLNKPGKLTDEEFAIIKSHTTQGYEALKQITIMPELAVGAQAHHERPDGRGYPNHLKGDEIPRVAQIIAVADCFDAMYSNRPYRNRMNFDKVVSIIREVSGTQLTADVVDAFLRLVDKGEFRDPDDNGGGSLENIENIRK